MKYPAISIVIPTCNAEPWLRSVLEAVFDQSLLPAEVIIIDSDSTDDTSHIAHMFPTRFLSIRREHFNHGATRNYGARIANGDYVVFLTQDAVPRDRDWLDELVKPLGESFVVGSFSRQIARDDASEGERFFYDYMYPPRSGYIGGGNEGSDRILFSNASSAIGRRFLLNNRFAEDIVMSEDFEWALRMCEEGRTIAYVSSSVVTHSHNASVRTTLKRYFYFGFSRYQIGLKHNLDSVLRIGFSIQLAEIKYLVMQGKADELARSVAYNATKSLGLAVGRSYGLLQHVVRERWWSHSG